jgi:hypothetical protein
VAVGDFDGDGKSDLAVANQSSNNVSILVGNGNGTFAPAVSYGAGSGPQSVAVGDFNGDGKSDLAVANFVSNNVSILLGKSGNGNGTFAAAVNYGAGSIPLSVAVGDFNRDGKSDLAVANLLSGDVSILLGNGDGTFAAAVNYTVGNRPTSIAVGDFNGDGKSDLAVVNNVSDDVSILLGNGDGTFVLFVRYGAGSSPTSVAVGDFNGDGKSDLAVTNQNSNNVSILFGGGGGVFSPPVNYTVGNEPTLVAVGDFNGDGKSDLAVANFGSDTISILLGIGNGGFAAPVNYGASTNPGFVAVGDFNGDGKSDLAVANNNSANVSILLNRSISICIGGISPNAGPTSGGQSTIISGSNLRNEMSVSFDGTAATVTLLTVTGITADSLTVTTPAHAAGAVNVVVTTGGGSDTLIGGYTYVDAPATPTGVTATAISSRRVDVLWTGVSGAMSYQIDHRAPGGKFTQVGTSMTNAFSDTIVSANTAYLFRIRAVNAGGTSGNSLPDLATTVIFTNGSLTPGTTIIHAVDFTELRTAVNAVRAQAGMEAVSFTDPTLDSTVTVKAVHVTELRGALDPAHSALEALGLPALPSYTDGTITATSTVIKAAHINDLRARVR